LKKYKLAPWDTAVKFFTISTVFIYTSGLLTYIILTNISVWMADNLANMIFIIIFLLLANAYLFSPRYYLINKREVTIFRLVGSVSRSCR
jgi:hypothetical protein